jgi:thiamine-phosphate diphosphorylase
LSKKKLVTDTSRRPASRPSPRSLPPLYPIIDVDLCTHRGIVPLAFAEACLAGGARLLQVRQKGTGGGGGALLALTRSIVSAARPFDAAVIVNDRADIAVMAGAAGVHVGQQDLPVPIVRALLGPDRMVGVSTHTPAQIEEALAGSADYLAVGPVFTTATKDTGYTPRGLDMVRQASGRGKPIVAIGGVTAGNAADVLAAGAASVAIISDLLSAADPVARVRQMVNGRWEMGKPIDRGGPAE